MLYFTIVYGSLTQHNESSCSLLWSFVIEYFRRGCFARPSPAVPGATAPLCRRWSTSVHEWRQHQRHWHLLMLVDWHLVTCTLPVRLLSTPFCIWMRHFYPRHAICLFICYKIVHEVHDRLTYTVRTMKVVKAALNTNTRQNTVYKITRKPCRLG